MRSSQILILLLTVILLACKSAGPQEAILADKKPNIILIMTDDQGWFDAGFNGNEIIRTPNLDKFAGQGMIFDRFYSASAVCSPTRASLITGRNPLRMNIPYANSGFMKTEELTIAEVLKTEGFMTGHFGKWHLGTMSKTILDSNRGGRAKFQEEYTIPSDHGYDQFFCSESKVPTYDPMFKPSIFEEGEGLRFGWQSNGTSESVDSFGTAYWSGAGQIEAENLDGDDSRVIMDRVLPFIKKANENEKAFFSTIWFHTPHLPVVADSASRSAYSELSLHEQLYYGSITAMDKQMGRLWSSLEEMGIEDETIIFFCSDNGPERGTPGSAGEFRERKRSLYEGGVRVPAFVVWKGKVKGGGRSNFPAVTSDYMPTILDLLEITYPEERPIDGLSLAQVMKGNEQLRSKPIGFICRPMVSWVDQQYKLVGKIGESKFELYDLLSDRSESKDLAKIQPEIYTKMEAELSEWMVSVENSKAGKDY